MSDQENSLKSLPRLHRELYGAVLEKASEDGMLATLMRKSDVPDPVRASHQGVIIGRVQHPMDFDAVRRFQTANEHHSACIQAKVQATVGLGFVTEQEEEEERELDPLTGQPTKPKDGDIAMISKVDEVLNPLCAGTWQETFSDVIEDFIQTGNGYLEVVRGGDGDEITGLHHIPAHEVFVFIEDAFYNRHYEVDSAASPTAEYSTETTRHFAVFGDRDGFLERAGSQGDLPIQFNISEDDRLVSEVIHFRRPTSLDRYYGWPDWVAAVASIELVQMLMQHHFDFFLNRGVPELIALFLGSKIDKKDWDEITTALQAATGLTNQSRSLVANLPSFTPEETEVMIQHLAQENNDDGDKFKNMRENLALGIVSAHRVPPLLAGIQIPGKLGATNELPNALMLFQLLVAGPYQRLISQTLGTTLGNPEINGGLGLTPEDFKFRRITAEIDLGNMDTVARMRQSPMQANAEGRDLSQGVKE